MYMLSHLKTALYLPCSNFYHGVVCLDALLPWNGVENVPGGRELAMPAEGSREDLGGTRKAGTRNTCSLRMPLLPALEPGYLVRKEPINT